MEFPSQYICATHAFTTLTKPVPAPYLRRSFQAAAAAKAELLITGLGFYELFLNGERITKGRLAPYISAPCDLVAFDRYDLTGRLREGENVLGVLLGNGFQNNPGGYVWDFDKTAWRGAPRTALRLTLTGPDGQSEQLESDEQFQTAPSPILFDDYRCGEIYDGRAELPGWCLPGFDASDWQPALRCDGPTGAPELCGCEPIVVTRELAPMSITREQDGYRYDFGENTAGVCRLSIRGEAGQVVTLRHGELLEDGRLELGNIKFEDRYGKDDTVQKDTYICRGDGLETYTPTFTYHGFQYVLVSGITERQATPELLTYLEMHSDLAVRGGFSCSDETANALQAMTRRSDLSNFFYFPNDCPHREKNGWTADASLSAEHMLLNLAPERSYRQWLHSIRLAMDERGALPGIVPTGGWGFAWGNGPAWDNVLFNLPYYTYLYRGDRAIVAENAAAMLRYLQYIGARLDADGLLAIGLGDWCPAGRSDGQHRAPLRLTDSILVADMAEKAAYLFGELGLAREADFARSLYVDMKTAVRARLLDLSTMTAAGRCQTSQAMALYYGMFEPGERPAAFARLLTFIEEAGGHLDVGVLGARVLFHVLSDFGRSDLAFTMITRPDFPSYGWWVAQGANTLWEDFIQRERGAASRNHHFWGDVSGWFLRCIVGLRVNPHRTGPDELTLAPSFLPQLTHAEGYHLLPAGRAEVAWRREKDGVRLDVTVPAGISGVIRLPDGWYFANGHAEAPLASGSYPLHG